MHAAQPAIDSVDTNMVLFLFQNLPAERRGFEAAIPRTQQRPACLRQSPQVLPESGIPDPDALLEFLECRKEIVEFVKDQIDHSLEEWGYHLLDLQINDITFDKAILESMSKVVASNNLKAAAENEGQALLITKTKAAEAEGNAIKISAGAEREAARLRGQGVALFRQEVAHGMSEAAEEMKKANLDTNVILFSMWTEAIKNFAEVGKGNIIFLDGSSQGMENTMRQIQSLMVKASGTSTN